MLEEISHCKTESLQTNENCKSLFDVKRAGPKLQALVHECATCEEVQECYSESGGSDASSDYKCFLGHLESECDASSQDANNFGQGFGQNAQSADSYAHRRLAGDLCRNQTVETESRQHFSTCPRLATKYSLG